MAFDVAENKTAYFFGGFGVLLFTKVNKLIPSLLVDTNQQLTVFLMLFFALIGHTGFRGYRGPDCNL